MQEDTSESPVPAGAAKANAHEFAESGTLLSQGTAVYRERGVHQVPHEQHGKDQITENGYPAFSGRSPREPINGLKNLAAPQLVTKEQPANVSTGASVENAELCVLELDVPSLQQWPSLGLSSFYQEECKKDGTPRNPLVLDCLILYDERTMHPDGKEKVPSTTKNTNPLDVACCGRDKRVFCQRLNDNQLIPVVRTLAFTGANLRSLDLSYNVLSDNAAVSLSTLLRCCCQYVAILNLQSNCISGTGCASLCESFAVCKSIESVNLSFNPLRKEGAVAVARWLETNPSVTTVRLNSCELDTDGLTALSVALKDKNTTVLELDVGNLTKSFLEPNHCYYLSGMLERNRTLRELCLAKQWIGDSGMKILVPFLKTNRSVVKLDLSCNQITFYGGRALRELLSENTTLEQLNLNCNRLAKYGAKSIAQGLKTNKGLVVLRINNNDIPPAGLMYLAEALKTNGSLTHMDVATNDFNSESAEAFNKFLGPQTPRPVVLTTDFCTYTIDGTTFIANTL